MLEKLIQHQQIVDGKKCIITQLREIEYPVGSNMERNFPIINSLGDFLYAFLKDNNINKVSLWCMGSSGTIIAGILASILMDKHIFVSIAHVKKEGENSHSNTPWVEHTYYPIFVDDFIRSGETFELVSQKASNLGVSINTMCVTGWVNTNEFPLVNNIICSEIPVIKKHTLNEK